MAPSSSSSIPVDEVSGHPLSYSNTPDISVQPVPGVRMHRLLFLELTTPAYVSLVVVLGAITFLATYWIASYFIYHCLPSVRSLLTRVRQDVDAARPAPGIPLRRLRSDPDSEREHLTDIVIDLNKVVENKVEVMVHKEQETSVGHSSTSLLNNDKPKQDNTDQPIAGPSCSDIFKISGGPCHNPSNNETPPNEPLSETSSVGLNSLLSECSAQTNSSTTDYICTDGSPDVLGQEITRAFGDNFENFLQVMEVQNITSFPDEVVFDLEDKQELQDKPMSPP